MPSPRAALWSQYCTYHGATDLTETNAWLQKLGEQGWELVGIGGQTATVYCFKTGPAEGPSGGERVVETRPPRTAVEEPRAAVAEELGHR